MPRRLTELDLRRRNCRLCKRWKHAIDFPWRWKARGKELPIPYILTICLVCKAEREKQRYQNLTPAEKRAKGVRANIQARQRRTRLVNEVNQLDQQVDKLNTKVANYQRRVGRVHRQYNGDALVDILPIRMFLLRQRKLLGGVAPLATALEMDHSRVMRLLNGYNDVTGGVVPIRQVTLSLIDEILVKLEADERIEDLYPELTG